MVTTTKNLISEISSNQEALQKFKKRQEDLQGVKRRLEEETAKTFNEVSATHKVVLEKRKRANELAASMERLEAMLAGGSGWTDDQKEQKVRAPSSLLVARASCGRVTTRTCGPGCQHAGKVGRETGRAAA